MNQQGRTREIIATTPFAVIPTKVGIQNFQGVTETLDHNFHRGDDKEVTISHVHASEGKQAARQQVEGVRRQ